MTKYFRYRWEAYDDPESDLLIENYVSAEDESVTTKSADFWGCYFRNLLRSGELNQVVDEINTLPHEGYYKGILSVEKLIEKASNQMLFKLFTMCDSHVSGQITEIQVEFIGKTLS